VKETICSFPREWEDSENSHSALLPFVDNHPSSFKEYLSLSVMYGVPPVLDHYVFRKFPLSIFPASPLLSARDTVLTSFFRSSHTFRQSHTTQRRTKKGERRDFFEYKKETWWGKVCWWWEGRGRERNSFRSLLFLLNLDLSECPRLSLFI